ncbi:hypothetical protein BJY00DRAFT_244967 [Aspergillus carlsbadensis]|nr:hypothetical protein BJY00DRAFT_244967 [Aspergillus carlsbadensis]
MDPSVMVSALHGAETPLPRRALRRGTKSCAECKRRKTRCFFERPTDATCATCQRRGMPCFGQEYMDVPVPSLGGEHTIVERLKRAELILGTISKDITPDGRNSLSAGSGSQSSSSQASAQDRSADQGRHGSESDLAHSTSSAHTGLERHEHEPYNYSPTKYAELCQVLHSHFPCQEDADILFNTGRATVFIQMICNHYGALFHQGDFRPLSSMTVLPPVTSHPVVLARKLLQVSLCFLQLEPSFDSSILHLDGSLKDTMNTCFNVATSNVTCRDDLLDSIEGLECLVYESVFLVNSGNIRRALASLRRASTLAQFMGLHRKKAPYRQVKQYDQGTHVSGAVVWAHITFLERYMCLLLGMPTAIARIRIGSDEPLPGDTSLDWFEKAQTDMFERMIERNQERNYHDLVATQKIDYELNTLANSVPSKWWTPLDLTQDMDNKAMMERVLSAHLQIVHYNLLAVLHLPYLLWDTDDSRFEYSKTTCIYASREVLNRYITFRSIVKKVTCCRPVDFCAFTAALTMLITYLNPHKQKSAMLAHQRMGDRALIESTLETMEELNKLNNDELSRRSAELVRKLLALETDCARGGKTYNSSVEETQEETLDEDHTFHLRIPYFGTVKLACDVPPAQFPGTVAPSFATSFNQYSTWYNGGPPVVEQPAQVPPLDASFPFDQSVDGFGNGFDLEMPDLLASADDWAFQGVDSAFFDAIMSGIPNPVIESENWGGYTTSI